MDDSRKTPHAPGGFAPEYRRFVLAPLFDAAKRHNDHYRRIDRAHAVMLGETGVLPRDTAAALLRGLDLIEGDLDLGAKDDAGAHEDLFFLREAALARRVGADTAGRLHTGRSRNDIEATVFRLQSKARLARLLDALHGLSGVVLARARRDAATPILAYTHGQPAQPTTFGHYLAAFAEVLARDARRLEAAHADIDACPLGAAAITTTGFEIDRARAAALLGFARVQVNAYGCIAAADQFAAIHSALRLLFVNLGRFVQDLVFWTSFEVGQVVAPDGFVQISSIMPQKRNPLALEHLRTMASLGAGHCDTAIGALHNAPFADMVDAEGPTQAAGLAAFDMAERALPLLGAFLTALEIDGARVAANIDASSATMTELADSLVRLEGLDFRAAHEIAARLSRLLVARRAGLSALTGVEIADAFAHVTGRAPTLDPVALKALCAVTRFIAVRERIGGPGPRALDAALADLQAELARGAGEARGRAAHEAASEAALDDAARALVG